MALRSNNADTRVAEDGGNGKVLRRERTGRAEMLSSVETRQYHACFQQGGGNLVKRLTRPRRKARAGRAKACWILSCRAQKA